MLSLAKNQLLKLIEAATDKMKNMYIGHYLSYYLP